LARLQEQPVGSVEDLRIGNVPAVNSAACVIRGRSDDISTVTLNINAIGQLATANAIRRDSEEKVATAAARVSDQSLWQFAMFQDQVCQGVVAAIPGVDV
jgi:hypothetical protein